MWCPKTSVSKTAVSLCRTCSHHGRYIPSLIDPTCVFPNLLMLEPVGVSLNFGDKTILLSGKWNLGHIIGKDFVDSYESQGFSTVQTFRHLIHRTFKRKNIELRKLKTLQAGEQKNLERIKQYCISQTKNIAETDTRFSGLDSVANFRRQKFTCRTNSYICATGRVNQSKSILNLGQISLCSVSRTLLNRKTKLEYCNCSGTCKLHTSVQRGNTQNGVTARLQPPWRILFFGTDDIALHTLKNLHRNMVGSGSLVQSLEVVTIKEQRAVRAYAESVELKVYEWPITRETDKYDVGVLVSFGHLIPDSVIHMFPYGILNMHPSLLPRWRGASPVIYTVLNGDDVTGVSIMEIRPKHFDVGPLLLQRKCRVPHRSTSLQLADILGPFGASMMLECLKDLRTLERFEHEQDSRGITYAHKLKQKNANIDWENSTAEEIDCQYRAISELMTLKTELDEHTVKLLDIVDPNILKDINKRDIRGYQGDIMHVEPGTVAFHKSLNCIVVRCKDGFVGFRTIVLRKRLTASDFYNGYINKRSCLRFVNLENDLNKFTRLERIPVKSKI